MPATFTAADTIRILVATDNHVGYNERDPVRGDDSWRAFDEIMNLARTRDVDMVLLAGDLFHENKPSRKSMYHVMRSLRINCFGEKPCELEMLSDGSEAFPGHFNHVNYEDPDINIALPVFSIHGNHDDPSGEGPLAPLDILHASGLLNYYGRTPESDSIHIKPVLLQKGKTKLALYGMSNVRDERLFRTFRDGGVKFSQPSTQQGDWFNIMSVHQNRHAYTDTGYLPEHFLPDFLDLVVWGHEHKCEIDPQTNPETTFRVMQPGSSVATSLVDGEAEPKHVAIVSVTGKEFAVEPIRLMTVRPFIYKEVTLQDNKAMHDVAYESENSNKVDAYLINIIDKMIDSANDEWRELQRESGVEVDEDAEPPKPIIRLRVEYTAPEGGSYTPPNPQRFSNRFTDRVANRGDVVQFHRRRGAAGRALKTKAEIPDEEVLGQITIDKIKVGELVQEYLDKQALSILPQNFFADVVGQFVDKDDKNAMEEFVKQSLEEQVKELIAKGQGDEDEDDLTSLMEDIKVAQEKAFAKGQIKMARKKGSRKPRPAGWDSDQDGSWEDNPASILRSEDEMVVDDDDDEDGTPAPRQPAGRGGRGRGRGAKSTAGTTRKTAAATTKKAPAKSTAAKSRKKQISDDEDDDEDDDVIMIDDDDDDDESQGLFVTQSTQGKTAAKNKAPTARATTSKTPAKTPARGGKAATTRQTQISFGSQANGSAGQARATGGRAAAPKRLQEPSDDEISDDDAFEPPPPTATARGGRKR